MLHRVTLVQCDGYLYNCGLTTSQDTKHFLCYSSAIAWEVRGVWPAKFLCEAKTLLAFTEMRQSRVLHLVLRTLFDVKYALNASYLLAEL